MATHTTVELATALSRAPRLALGHFPTPLNEAPRLSSRLGFRLLVKHDDVTGLALGGNKVRKLEFLIGDVLNGGHDCVITTGGSQSNHARLTAAACRRANLECHLVLDRGLHPEFQGNLLLDELLGANIHLVESQDPEVAAHEMESLGGRLRATGLDPYIIPRGGSTTVGARGYASFVVELLGQLDSAGIDATHLYLATGSTGTHSGTIAGLTASSSSIQLQGISVSRNEEQQVEKVHVLSNATLEALGLSARVTRASIHVDDRFVGAGYGHTTAATMEAIEIAALDEGIILDPVYTGKPMAGLLAHAREGKLQTDDIVVFVHTGGAPALFAYHAEVAAALGAAAPA